MLKISISHLDSSRERESVCVLRKNESSNTRLILHAMHTYRVFREQDIIFDPYADQRYMEENAQIIFF